MDWLIAGLPATGMIIALVEGAKRAGMASRWAPILAIALGVIFGVAAHLIVVLPGGREWSEAIVSGIALGLTAAGLYSGAKAIRTSPF